MSQFRPLLAATCDDSNIDKLHYPLLASPKLDGIRVIIRDGIAQTRSLKPVRNKHVQKCLGHSLFNGLDGEICAGNVLDPKCFRNTTTAVMAEDAVVPFTYWVFDDFLQEGEFAFRIARLKERAERTEYVGIKVLEHVLIEDRYQLEAYEDDCLTKGFEGVMLRSLNGKYKHNRSTFNEGILLKLKRGQIVNGDALIIGFKERMHNANEATIDERGFTKRSVHKENKIGRGDLGALLVKEILRIDENGDYVFGHEFSIGNGDGLDDSLRKKIWDNQADYLRKIVRFEWFKYGAYDKPRFPKYVAIRDPDDMSEG